MTIFFSQSILISYCFKEKCFIKICFNCQIVGLGASEHDITSHSVRLDWLLSDISGANLLEYQPAYSIAGEDHWIQLNWTKLPDMSFTFKGLIPFTK